MRTIENSNRCEEHGYAYKRPGFVIEWKGIGVVSGSYRTGNGYSDWVSTSVSLSLSTDRLRLPTTALSTNDGPATSAISVSCRTTSGSDLVANPVLSEWISARTVALDQLSAGSRAEYHLCKLELGDYFQSGYFRFRWVQGAVPGADAEIGLLVGSTKPGFSMGKRGFYGRYT